MLVAAGGSNWDEFRSFKSLTVSRLSFAGKEQSIRETILKALRDIRSERREAESRRCRKVSNTAA